MLNTTTAIVFPGQGSQIVGMGLDLAQNFSVAKHLFDEIDEYLQYKLSSYMFNGPSEELTKTQHTQPALMAVSMAIVRVLQAETGLKFKDFCSFTAGHSLGEYSALCASSSLSLCDTAKLLKVRGSEMAKCGLESKGSMAALLGATIETAQQLVNDASQGDVCQVANDNSVGQVVISGTIAAIERAVAMAKDYGIKRAIILPVSGAFHSKLMLSACEKMAEALSSVTIGIPEVAVVANVTADVIDDYLQIKNLLIQQITGSVRWRETMLLLQSKKVERIIEIGSGKVLSGLVAKTCPQIESLSIQNSQDIADFLKKI